MEVRTASISITAIVLQAASSIDEPFVLLGSSPLLLDGIERTHESISVLRFAHADAYKVFELRLGVVADHDPMAGKRILRTSRNGTAQETQEEK